MVAAAWHFAQGSPHSFMEEIARIRAAFSLSLWPLSAALCRDASATLRGDRHALGRLSTTAHRIAGTAATLNINPLADIARALEDAIESTPNDRWVGCLFATFRATLQAATPSASIAKHLDRSGNAREAFCSNNEPWSLESKILLQLTQVASLDALPRPPRGALVLDARTDTTSRLRKARAAWGSSNPLIAILSGESEAESLLALRAGADYLHFAASTEAEAMSAIRVRLSAWAALPPPFAGAIVLVVDSDSLRSSFLRAVLEPFGARVHCEDDPAHVEKRLRTDSPHIVVIDPSRTSSVELLRAQKHAHRDRFLISYGPTSWSDASLDPECSVESVVPILGDALRSVLGSAHVSVRLLDETTETIKVSRAEVLSILPSTPRRQ